MKYVLSVDQSTQGTKALLFDGKGSLLARQDVPHRQIISDLGWVSHDPGEIYRNLTEAVRLVIQKAQIPAEDIACLAITNQRETSVVWEKATGKPICDAIVWQCGRAKELCGRVEKEGYGEMVRSRTGIPISPFFPASKFSWMVHSIPGAEEQAHRHELCFGTIDTWLVYCLTGGKAYLTDYSNASRTQLFNIHTLSWDREICEAFGLCADDLAEVTDSDGFFGMTNVDGVLPKPVPIRGVLGDSHGALFGQGCLQSGMAKATYGTGSSVMMNVGAAPIDSRNGLVTSLAWKYRGQVHYVMEGNLNYTGAVIRWLEKDLGLVASASETEQLACSANPEDTTILVPAFTGLGAPYWNNDVKAMICGISRLTGRAELVKAGLDCIAYQITDIVRAMEQDAGIRLDELRVDGGPTRNKYLMQLQSDLLRARVLIPNQEELSGIGVAYLAGIACGIYNESVLDRAERSHFDCKLDKHQAEEKYSLWQEAVGLVLQSAGDHIR